MKINIGRLQIIFSVRITPTYMKECITSIKEGKMLNAVRIYKNNTGKGLSESKDYIFELRDNWYATGNFDLNKSIEK